MNMYKPRLRSLFLCYPLQIALFSCLFLNETLASELDTAPLLDKRVLIAMAHGETLTSNKKMSAYAQSSYSPPIGKESRYFEQGHNADSTMPSDRRGNITINHQSGNVFSSIGGNIIMKGSSTVNAPTTTVDQRTWNQQIGSFVYPSSSQPISGDYLPSNFRSNTSPLDVREEEKSSKVDVYMPWLNQISLLEKQKDAQVSMQELSRILETDSGTQTLQRELKNLGDRNIIAYELYADSLWSEKPDSPSTTQGAGDSITRCMKGVDIYMSLKKNSEQAIRIYNSCLEVYYPESDHYKVLECKRNDCESNCIGARNRFFIYTTVGTVAILGTGAGIIVGCLKTINS